MSLLRKNIAIVFATLATAVMLCLALAGCSSAPTKASNEWLSYDVPQGYQVVNESENGLGISTSKDTDIRLNKFGGGTIWVGLWPYGSSEHSAADVIANKLKGDKLGNYTDIGTRTFAGREFHLMTISCPNGTPGIRGCADLNDSAAIELILYDVSLDDDKVKTVLESLTIDESKVPSLDK